MPQLDRRRRNPSPANAIAGRLQQIRKDRSITQGELAGMLQTEVLKSYPDLAYTLDQSDVSRIEAGIRPVWDYELKAIASALGISTDYLLNLVDEHGRVLDDDEEG